MRISFNAFMAEMNGKTITGVIDTPHSTDAFYMECAACYREDGSTIIANRNRSLLIDLDIIVHIERAQCLHDITEYEITTINSTITLDALGREGRA